MYFCPYTQLHSMQDSNHFFIVPKSIPTNENSNGLAIVLRKQNNDDLNNRNLEMINRLIEAMKLIPSQTTIITLDDKDFIKLPTSINKFYLFGINPKQVGFNISTEKNKVFQIANKLIIITDDATQMHNDQLKKKAFWEVVSKLQ